MNGTQILDQLRTQKTYVKEMFGLLDIALFGALARGNAANNSDIDLLVRFDGPATSYRYFGVQFYLEDLRGVSIHRERSHHCGNPANPPSPRLLDGAVKGPCLAAPE